MDRYEEQRMSQQLLKDAMIKKGIWVGIIAICLLVALILAPQIVDTVDKGSYQVKQAALSGTMSAKMTPGIWFQNFGDIEEWPTAETFFFTSTQDTEDDSSSDNSMEVRFNDGSLCNISGTARISMPKSEDQAINLVTAMSFKTYSDCREKLIRPTIRNVLRHTANLMSATDSYSEKRPDYISWCKDQIQNGLYQTEVVKKDVIDLVSGETVQKNFTVRKKIKGIPQYQANPLEGTGITVANFEVKFFGYEDKVKNQIGEQQKARMAVQTAKAKAQEAEQKKFQIEAEGKARVAKAEYQELEKKIVAVVQANRDKEVAETHAAQKLEVAKLEKLAAAEDKQKNILEGQGIAEKKRLVLKADGALKQKLATLENINKVWASAYAKRNVPNVYMEGKGGSSNGNPDQQVQTFMQMMNIKAMRDLAVDTTIPKGNNIGG